MRSFCIAGSIDPEKYYFVPTRLAWQLLNSCVERSLYFSIHAPRQSGKSTAAKEYVRHLQQEGQYKALYCSLDNARATGNDEALAIRTCIIALKDAIENEYPEDKDTLAFCQATANTPFYERASFSHCIKYWCRTSDKPIVLLLDEVEGLDERPLVALLAQIRSGFEQERPHNLFPHSMGLISMRYLKDYSLPQGEIKGEKRYSPFNILAKFIRIPDFTPEQVESLYWQHTQETGQKFTAEAIHEAFTLTNGQPWLVNALANQACFEDALDHTQVITAEVIHRAKHNLVLQHATHIDNLIERLKEKRVSVIIDAILAGETTFHYNEDDVTYIRNLGLIKQDSYQIANPIYQEVFPRALAKQFRENVFLETAWYVETNGKLNVIKLLEAFTDFYRCNAEKLLPDTSYHESYPHLLLYGFLHRIINGGGEIITECALGKRRADLLITWKGQKIVIELKIKQTGEPLAESLYQTAKYMDTVGGDEGHLIIFDRDALRQKASWKGRVGHQSEQTDTGDTIEVWRL